MDGNDVAKSSHGQNFRCIWRLRTPQATNCGQRPRGAEGGTWHPGTGSPRPPRVIEEGALPGIMRSLTLFGQSELLGFGCSSVKASDSKSPWSDAKGPEGERGGGGGDEADEQKGAMSERGLWVKGV